MSLWGHDTALGGENRSSEIFGDELEKFGGTPKKVVRYFARRLENIFGRNLFKKIQGHPRTSLAPGIQQPLHATAQKNAKRKF